MPGHAMPSPSERLGPGRRRSRRRAFLWVACAAVAALLSAAGVLYAAYGEWVGTGPLATGQGNRVVTALAVSAADPNVLYAGTGSATVFRSAQPTTRPMVPGILFLLQ